MPRRHKHDPEEEEESEKEYKTKGATKKATARRKMVKKTMRRAKMMKMRTRTRMKTKTTKRMKPPTGPLVNTRISLNLPKPATRTMLHTYPSRPDSAIGDFTMKHQPGVSETEDFVLSNCSGTKKVLLIGINYSSHESGKLDGCINDVINIRKFFIEKYKFPEQYMLILTDDREDPNFQPTKQNILMAMQWLVMDAKPNDSLFFHFSGHGGRLEDQDGDEDDGWDETICPVDYQTEGEIRDDTMFDIMVAPLPRVAASPPSSTPATPARHWTSYVYKPDGTLQESDPADDAQEALRIAQAAMSRGDGTAAYNALVNQVQGIALNGGKKKLVKDVKADVIMFSGCKDIQTSSDTVEDGEATGAMSYALRMVLDMEQDTSYQQLLIGLRMFMKMKGYSQTPQLSSSHPMDMRLKFIM